MTKKKKKTTSYFKKWLLAIIILGFLAFCYQATVYIQNREALPKIKAEFEKINKDIYQKSDLSVWWISIDNLNIINDNASGIEIDVTGCTTDTEDRKLFFEITNKLAPVVDSIAKKAGFTKNIINSSEDINDTKFYDYIQAYERDNQKCVFKADPDCSSFIDQGEVHYAFSFSCTTDFDKNYQTQSSFLKDLEIKDAVVHLDKKSGDFITLNVNYRRSGYYIIAKKIDNKWVQLFAGQDYPPCATINQYKIPKELYSTCY